MDFKRLLLIAISLGALIVLIYICHMLAPLFDDVWKILVAGVPVGFLLGFWCGVKWKEFSIKAKEEIKEERAKLRQE